MATGITIHYREDVSDRPAAERVLKPHPPRSYITWRVGATDDQFVLSYNSAAFSRTEHVALRRLPSGAFQPSQSVGEDASQPYATLGEFIATRRYLDAARAVSTLPAPGSPATPAPAAAGGGAELTHRRPAAPALGGRADVPAELPLPAPKGPDDDDLLIPPTCAHGVQRAVFAACVLLAAGVAGRTWAEYRHHEGAVVAQAAELAAVATAAVGEATAALKAALTAVGPPGGQDPAACAAAGAAWRAGVAAAKAAVEPAFASGDAPTFIRHLLGLVAVGWGGGWALLCVTTGRRMESDVETAAGAGVTDDMDAGDAMARISGGGARPPAITRMQAAWGAAFWGLVGAGLYAGAVAFHTLWDYAAVGDAVVKAARPLSLRFRCGNTTTTSAAAGVGGAPFYGGGDGGWPTDDAGLPAWRPGDTCAGVRALRLSVPCADALQPFLEGLLDMPPLLTLPVDRILPLPGWAVRALLPGAAGAPLVHRGGHGRLDDELALDDPFAGTRLAGWVDGTHLVVPSPQGVAFAVLDTLCALTAVYLATLLAREALSQNGPRLRAWWARRGGALRRGGGGAPKAHKD